MALISPSAKRTYSSSPEIIHRNSICFPRFSFLNCRSLSKRQFSFSKTLSTSSHFLSEALISDSRRARLGPISSSLRCLEDDEGSPWEGAIIYKRDASVTHLEYCTTLERLGLDKLSSELSKSRASSLGLRVTRTVKDFPLGTPVQLSIDVTRKKKKLRLDGIVKTVITLGCNRCAEPAAEGIFSNFSLLLSEEPIKEPDTIYLFGDDFKSSNGEDEDEDIDVDDQLYFPVEVDEIDISKHIRDILHVEITINAICDPNCKGLCLKCGVNLNKSSCNCSKGAVPKNDKVFTET
ncbi:large ribosomal RNA subunit accumulation protein YCED homolog 1, chloroplastic [Aristolochia californica]|uniref:large ribosomal RNA subunit accumulation protein YCED homolog 1, chloroplastic n=1 Tax=Aristolochia californica TaxID=171875 RepID=UPI0035DBC724